MAKRTIHECDLTKQEFDPDDDQLFTLTISKKGRKAPMKYEVSAAAAEKLLNQLNGRNVLSEDWSFTSIRPTSGAPARRTTLSDLEDEPTEGDDDSSYVAEKKAELREAGVLREEREEPVLQHSLGVVSDGCMHINKGRIQTTVRSGKRHIYRRCNECRKEVPEMTAEERKQYLSGKVSGDINMRDMEK